MGIADDGLAAAEATLPSGLEAGLAEPHPDLSEREDEPQAPIEEPPPSHPLQTLAQVHAVFKRWFGEDYDTAVIDAVMAAGAAERLARDPLWLLVVRVRVIPRLRPCNHSPA